VTKKIELIRTRPMAIKTHSFFVMLVASSAELFRGGRDDEGGWSVARLLNFCFAILERVVPWAADAHVGPVAAVNGVVTAAAQDAVVTPQAS